MHRVGATFGVSAEPPGFDDESLIPRLSGPVTSSCREFFTPAIRRSPADRPGPGLSQTGRRQLLEGEGAAETLP